MRKGLALRKADGEVVQKRNKTTREAISATRVKKKQVATVDIEYFKQILLDKRREIVGDVNEIHDKALKKSRLDASGDLSSMPIHMADIGTDNYEQEFALGLMDSERKLLKEIDDALQRIESKTYGICEATNKPITKARLEAKPWARYCVEYVRMVEQGLTVEQDETTPELEESTQD
ncbi:MAG: TraR/DksA C4-type zinc finger protein [Planctomycetes bacterium]|nr:TraR/DksA C4-type zinc finger protein [Planctomycetota bacterium]